MKIAEIQNDSIIINEAPSLTLNNRKGAIAQVLGCGLCGSDIVKFVHKLSPDGTVPGHEIVARITEIDSVTDFKTGDVILSSHHVPCGKCSFCKNGNESMCLQFKNTNIEPGGFSEYIYLSDEHLKNVAYKKPENLSDEEAAFYEPLGCCVRAIRRTCLPEGSSALVIGLGSIGNIMAQALNAFGVKAAGFDLKRERMDILENIWNSEPGETFTPHAELSPYDAVFMTSGADAAIETALKSVRDGGKIIVFSSTPKNSGYVNNEIYYRELTVTGSYSPAPEDLKTSLNLLASGKVNVKNLSEVYDFEDINQAFKDAIANKVFKAYIKIVNHPIKELR
ncbi:MAG: alcohol dehydrogenase catalytic domain-containing protein [Heliobacteriaceae bacterium]|jgi:L-iditol 2-dehydrogenase|nr:alcohol dehydrogenase catalytic domain-containing protein [Heliobacteriaceae bacterium]